MAQFPCEHCGQRYRGPGNRAYVSILNGGQKWEHKPRLCQVHLDELKDMFDRVQGLISEGSTQPYRQQPCLVCAGSVDGQHPHSVFMTTFAGRDQREDWFAPVCEVCRPDAERALRGFTAGP